MARFYDRGHWLWRQPQHLPHLSDQINVTANVVDILSNYLKAFLVVSSLTQKEVRSTGQFCPFPSCSASSCELQRRKDTHSFVPKNLSY